jgi:hypothetical protein
MPGGASKEEGSPRKKAQNEDAAFRGSRNLVARPASRHSFTPAVRGSAPSASTGYRGHEAVGAKTRTATAKTLTKAFGSPVMIREVGSRDMTTLGFLWRILAGFFVTLTMIVAWRMLPCEAGAFWPRPVFWSRRGFCRAPDGLPARVGTTPTRRARPTPTIGRTWSGRGRCRGLRSNAPAGPARSGRAYCAPEVLRWPDVPWGEKKT